MRQTTPGRTPFQEAVRFVGGHTKTAIVELSDHIMRLAGVGSMDTPMPHAVDIPPAEPGAAPGPGASAAAAAPAPIGAAAAAPHKEAKPSKMSVAPSPERTQLIAKLDEIHARGKEFTPAVLLIDLAGFGEINDTKLHGSRAHVVGLLEHAKRHNIPVIHVEIGPGQSPPPCVADYPKYVHTHKMGWGSINAMFSVLPAIRGILEILEIKSLFIAGCTRNQCVENSIFGEQQRFQAERVPETAALEYYHCYTGAAYTRDLFFDEPHQQNHADEYREKAAKPQFVKAQKEFMYFDD
ncbi:MAG: hypothetical protein K0U29_06495 [Gammaproteobacteria bacterium]|nr:hypothetical protein [Gammaproteobacteria bacterium]MCH9744563.1 hypothetical protein [Gammaproteobacteria bacterium]